MAKKSNNGYTPPKRSRQATIAKLKRDKMYYIMFLPVFILTLVFSYVPMAGIRYAFYNFNPFMRTFVGIDNFKAIFTGIYSNRFWVAFSNTLRISLISLVLGTVLSVLIALLLNEIYVKVGKSFVQTLIYLPHFLSWVVVASIFIIILSPQGGFINSILDLFGIKSIYFFGDSKWWGVTYQFVNRWKETGWGTIIYIAALTSISPELYEAARIDGAGRWKQTLYITLPSLSVTILTVFILNLAKVMDIFQSVYAMYNDRVYDVADVIATLSYRIGMQEGQYGLGTAIGLFRSLIGLILVLAANKISAKIKGEGIL